MVQGQVFLKGGGGRRGGWHFPYLFLMFSRLYHFYIHLEIFLPFAFAKLCYAFEEKLFFTATIILCTW